MCVRERERERERVCVCERERERGGVCVCEREREGESNALRIDYSLYLTAAQASGSNHTF